MWLSGQKHNAKPSGPNRGPPSEQEPRRAKKPKKQSAYGASEQKHGAQPSYQPIMKQLSEKPPKRTDRPSKQVQYAY